MDIKQTEKQKEVSEYYVQVQQTQLQTQGCTTCPLDFKQKPFLKDAMSKIAKEIQEKYYGCGTPIPECLKDQTVLDLGCGTGKDVYICSYLGGENSHVIGIDMTKEQLEIAEKYKEIQMKEFNYEKCNVEFKKGVIEDLGSLGIQDRSIDIVISNCVVNLVEDKRKVLKEVWRVLKDGGELYFSDIYSNKRIPEELQKDKVLWGECLSGALYWEDFRRIMQEVGFNYFCTVSSRTFKVEENEKVKQQCGSITFSSVTVRAFKIANLEDICEDYGQTAIYNGGIPYTEEAFQLDKGHLFKKGETMKVCGNTADFLSKTRFKNFFTVTPRQLHQGKFQCAKEGEGQVNQGCCGKQQQQKECSNKSGCCGKQQEQNECSNKSGCC